MVDVIEKALGGTEDLLFGQGTVAQTRNNTSVNITKINGSVIPFSGDSATSDLVSLVDEITVPRWASNSSIRHAELDVGVADAIAFTPTPAPVSGTDALIADMWWLVKPAAASTGGPMTVQVGTLPAVSLKNDDGTGALTDPAANAVLPYNPIAIYFDGTQFLLLGQHVAATTYNPYTAEMLR